MAKEPPAYLWLDGKVVAWQDGPMHVPSEAVVRGESVFEGVRAYGSSDGKELYIFKNQEHLVRLRQSAKIMRMSIPYSDQELTTAFKDFIRANGYRDSVHFRPTVYFGEGESNQFDPAEIRTGMFCIAYHRPRRSRFSTASIAAPALGAVIATWRRHHASTRRAITTIAGSPMSRRV